MSKTYLALGDSYTIGEAVAEADRWPVRLARDLTESGTLIAPPTIVATTGWTTDELLAGIEAQRDELLPAYDLVSLLIGVNNQYRDWPLETYRKEFTDLLDYAISKCSGGAKGVFVVSIPDYAYTPEGEGKVEISKGVADFNAAAKAICERRSVPFLNITPVSEAGLKSPELVAADKLHPSGAQYRLWVEVIREGYAFEA
jgi:lysophospholipase L1-like esterase